LPLRIGCGCFIAYGRFELALDDCRRRRFCIRRRRTFWLELRFCRRDSIHLALDACQTLSRQLIDSRQRERRWIVERQWRRHTIRNVLIALGIRGQR
jgi:hypothetical protein